MPNVPPALCPLLVWMGQLLKIRRKKGECYTSHFLVQIKKVHLRGYSIVCTLLDRNTCSRGSSRERWQWARCVIRGTEYPVVVVLFNVIFLAVLQVHRLESTHFHNAMGQTLAKIVFLTTRECLICATYFKALFSVASCVSRFTMTRWPHDHCVSKLWEMANSTYSSKVS